MSSRPEHIIPALSLSPSELLARMPQVGDANLGSYAEQSLQQPGGRILRLRLGMNPNSSSVGTNVIVFMWTLSACAAVFTIASGLLAARFHKPESEARDQHDANER